MARSPLATSSTATLLSIGRRVSRLCDQAGNGSQKYAVLIIKAQEKLSTAAETAAARTLDRMAAYDAALLADTQLDNAVRFAFHACQQYDQTVEALPVLEKAFPKAVFSPIVTAPRPQEREMVSQVIACLRSVMPEAGPLTEAVNALTAALKQAEDAQQALDAAQLEESKSRALEALARKEFVEEYNAVYHTAYGDLGHNRANKLFPLIRNASRKPATTNQEGEEKPIRAAA